MTTPRAFVAGFPIKHSRSPLIHGHWLEKHGLAGSYERIEVAPSDFSRFVQDLKSGEAGLLGGNITIPHKEQAFALADRPERAAEELGAANTLWLEEGMLHATNTDGYGFVSNLDAAVPGWDRPGGKDGAIAVILGAGGASRAVIQALRDRGFAVIHVVNRTPQRAVALADWFGSRIHAHDLGALPEVMQGADLLVNTTSLGMADEAVPDLDFAAMKRGAVVTDIVYTPLLTPLLAMARADGMKTVDGLGMLLHQAVPGFQKWFGVRPEVTDELRALVVADIEGAP